MENQNESQKSSVIYRFEVSDSGVSLKTGNNIIQISDYELEEIYKLTKHTQIETLKG
ncbi:MAG: hypothetical protein M1467_03085 [Deltaproteobacteria bacterium]|jgi:hypothetical protein|nr:hypothetical protein [Deltaproteobacteria bacterium]